MSRTPEHTLSEVARVLHPAGSCKFSVVHPVLSAPAGRWVQDASGVRRERVVGDYFSEGPAHRAMDLRCRTGRSAGPVSAVHGRLRARTLAGWLSAVLSAGLVIEAIAEPRADEQTAAAHPQVADTRIAPYCLIVRAGKP
jgi:hypothetical protein